MTISRRDLLKSAAAACVVSPLVLLADKPSSLKLDSGTERALADIQPSLSVAQISLQTNLSLITSEQHNSLLATSPSWRLQHWYELNWAATRKWAATSTFKIGPPLPFLVRESAQDDFATVWLRHHGGKFVRTHCATRREDPFWKEFRRRILEDAILWSCPGKRWSRLVATFHAQVLADAYFPEVF